MRSSLLVLLALLPFLGAAPVRAADAPRTTAGDTAGNTADRTRDGADVRSGHAARNDAQGRSWIEVELDRFRTAREKGDADVLGKIDEQVTAYLASGGREPTREARKARSEVHGDRRAAHADRRSAPDAKTEAAPSEDRAKADSQADDQATAPQDKRDDRSDRRDDRKDAAPQTDQQKRMGEIRDEWADLAGHTESADLDLREQLLQELVKMAGDDTAQSTQNAGEQADGRTERHGNHRQAHQDRGGDGD